MATITTQTIKVDLTPGRVYPVLHVSQGDVGLEALEFYIYQNNQPYTIPAEVTAINIDGMTPVGVFSYPCTWSGNVVTAGLTATMTAEKGVDICELAFYDATNNKIGTCNFVIAVEESPFTNAHVSTSDMATIMAAASSAQQYELLSKSWAVGDTGIRTGEDTNNSEYWANISESWAVGGTGKRAGEDTNNSEYWSGVAHQYANTVSFKTYDTVAQMKADTGLLDGAVCRTLGYYAANDGGGMLYRIANNYDYFIHEWETLSNGLYAVRVTTLESSKFAISGNLQGNPYSGLGNNGAAAISALLDVCSSYEDNSDKLYYGHYSALDYGDYDMSNGLSDGKYQIDCSAFTQLALAGIGYSGSRYSGAANVFTSTYSYFPYLTESEYQTTDRYAKYRLSYEQALFAYRNGFGFMPNFDWSNVQPGDVVYIQDGDTPSDNPLGVDHCMIYIGRKGRLDNLYFYECGGNNSHRVSVSSGGVVHVCERTLEFMLANTKLVARYPLGASDGQAEGCVYANAAPTLPQSFSAEAKTDLYTCTKIKAGEWYTVILTVSGKDSAYYVTDTGHICVAPGTGVKATFIHTYRATVDFSTYRMGSYDSTDTDITVHGFAIVKGYATSEKVPRAYTFINNVSSLSGSYTTQAANAWENTGLTFTVPQNTRYLVTASTGYNAGRPIGIGFDTKTTLTLPPAWAHEADMVYNSPAFLLLPGTYHLFAKRGGTGANNYAIYALQVYIS